MEQSAFPISRNLSLERLVTAALGEIERLGYSRRSRNRYRAIWAHLIEFSGRKRLGDQFSGELAARFLEEYRVTGDEIDMSGQGWRKHMVWGVRALADFAENGRIERAFTEAIDLVPAMQNTLCDYAQYLMAKILRPINGRVAFNAPPDITMNDFVEKVYFPFYRRKWKRLTAESRTGSIRHHVLGTFGSRTVASLTRDEMQNFLDDRKTVAFTMVDHLRWDLNRFSILP